MTVSFSISALPAKKEFHSPFTIDCRLCFVKLKLLLLSIEAKQGESGDTKISINPRHNKIAANMVGFFMAQSAEEVKR